MPSKLNAIFTDFIDANEGLGESIGENEKRRLEKAFHAGALTSLNYALPVIDLYRRRIAGEEILPTNENTARLKRLSDIADEARIYATEHFILEKKIH